MDDFMEKVLAEADKMEGIIEKAKMEIKIEKGKVEFNATGGTKSAYGFMILTALCNIVERVPDMKGSLRSACEVFLDEMDKN
jgi:hypothetical protein